MLPEKQWTKQTMITLIWSTKFVEALYCSSTECMWRDNAMDVVVIDKDYSISLYQ